MDHETLKNFIKDNLVIDISEDYTSSDGRYVRIGLRFTDEKELFSEDSFFIADGQC